MKIARLIVIFTGLSLIAIIIHGYNFGVSDQKLIIPYLYKIDNSQLFPGDRLFNQISASASLFYYIYAFLIKWIDIQWLFFISYIIFNAIFFYLIKKIAGLIFTDEKLSYLALLPFFLPKFIGGTATLTFDLFWGYRALASLFLLWSLYLIMKNRLIRASLVIGMGIWIHPPTFLSISVILIIYCLINLRKQLKESLISIVLILIFGIVYQFAFIHNITGVTNDPGWIGIITSRYNFVFLSRWNLSSWLSLLMFCCLSLVCLLVNGFKFKRLIVLIFCVTAGYLVISWVSLDLLKLVFMAKLQLLRSLDLIAFTALIFSPVLLTLKNRLLNILGMLSFIGLALNLYYLAALSLPILIFCLVLKIPSKNFVKFHTEKRIVGGIIAAFCIGIMITNISSYKDFTNFIQFPKRVDGWIDMQLYAKSHTASKAVFLVDPKTDGFRLFSKRSIVGDNKDGATVIYSADYASYWANLMTDLNGYKMFNKDDFERLSKKYTFNYIVVESSKSLPFNEIYKNNRYILYKVR